MAMFSREIGGIEVVKQLKGEVEGKTILVTGTTDGGLGSETAVSLAHANPAHLLLLARSETKVAPVVSKIQSLNSSIKVDFVSIELDDFNSVRKAAGEINSKVSKLDIIINNAGVMAIPFKLSKHNIETQFNVNHLGHFLLTALLFPKVVAAGKGARIVNLTSDGYKLGRFNEDYNFNNGADYSPWSGYGQAKTANILFTRQLATKLASRGIQSFAVHPGVIFGTGLALHIPDFAAAVADIDEIAMRNTGKPFGGMDEPITLQQGVATTLMTALDPHIADHTGTYWAHCQEGEVPEYASSLENAQRLWNVSEKLVGEKFEL